MILTMRRSSMMKKTKDAEKVADESARVDEEDPE